MDKVCVFCKIANKEVPADIVYEDDDLMAFRDLNPQAPIHFLIIPKRHIATMNDVDGEVEGLAGRIVAKVSEIAREQGIADGGYRTVINCNRDAGQEVFHLHAHVLGGRKMTWPPG